LYDNAITLLHDSADKLPENASVRYHLGMAYFKKGDKQKARTELEKAVGLSASFEGADEARAVLKGM
jgi:Tfp pilus assembly protein PilF